MVCKLIELLYLPDVSTNDGFLFFVNSNVSEDLHVCELLILKFSKSCRNLMSVLLIEDNLKNSGIIIDLKSNPHHFISA